MKENPKSLGVVVQYGYALQTLGQFDEMLTLANGIIAKVDKAPRNAPPYEDLDDELNWIHNHKANALRALGRWDEAAAALETWERSDRNRDDKVSQAINLGFFYNEMGRPEDALKAVAGLDDSKGMSEYGRTQLQFVRFQANQQLGKEAETQQLVTWMREHKDDSMETAQDALLEAGDVDGAAALMLARLNDADDRTGALAEIQIYAQVPRTERQKKTDALAETLLARPDVAAAIAQYGRREAFPIYSLEF
jgi:tetratricopeptide (TPR) repeat protein